eukprot:5036692-Amphidinium_carterae.1
MEGLFKLHSSAIQIYWVPGAIAGVVCMLYRNREALSTLRMLVDLHQLVRALQSVCISRSRSTFQVHGKTEQKNAA